MTEPREVLAVSRLADRLQEAILDLDSRQLMAEAQGYSSAEWRRWTTREIAEDLARQVARSEGPGLDAPSLDEGLLARALATTPINFGYSVEWWTDLAPRLAAEYRRLAQEGETP